MRSLPLLSRVSHNGLVGLDAESVAKAGTQLSAGRGTGGKPEDCSDNVLDVFSFGNAEGNVARHTSALNK